MHLTVPQKALSAALSDAAPFVAGKSTLPVLMHVLLTAHDSTLTISATNLEVGVQIPVGANVITDGAITVPVKLFASVVKDLPADDLITLRVDAQTQTLNIAAGRYTSNIKGIDADEFPIIPRVETSHAVPCGDLLTALNQTTLAAATDDTRPVLTGVHLRIGRSLILAAADGFRLAKWQQAIPEDVATVAASLEAIAPALGLRMLTNLLARVPADMPAQIGLSTGNGQIGVTMPTGATFVSRLVEGKFPDVDRVIPASRTTRLTFDRSELIKAVKVASYFATESSNIIRLRAADAVAVLTANAAEVGDGKAEIPAQVDGAANEIAVNCKYFADALGAVSSAKIVIDLVNATSPLVLREDGSDRYVHIIMPMTVR